MSDRQFRLRACGLCSADFVPKSGNQRYCTPQCSAKVLKAQQDAITVKRREAREAEAKDCAVCGQEFIPYSSKNIYCTDECAGKGFVQRIHERRIRLKQERAEARAQRKLKEATGEAVGATGATESHESKRKRRKSKTKK